MIGLRKLKGLRRETRLRKIASILYELEGVLQAGGRIDLDYLVGLGTILSSDDGIPARTTLRFRGVVPSRSSEALLRLCNDTRHDLLALLGAEPAEWDFSQPGTRHLEARRTVLPLALYLDDIRSPFNVGAIFRCAEAFGVSRILISEATPSPGHPRARRSSMGCTEVIPWEVSSPADVGAETSLFALETGGTPLDEFRFPASGIMVVGSEELGVRPELLARADRAAGRVTIPMLGAKASLNVGQALSVALYRWAYMILSEG
jgi:RNA methyltransferase, TrmH family